MCCFMLIIKAGGIKDIFSIHLHKICCINDNTDIEKEAAKMYFVTTAPYKNFCLGFGKWYTTER